MKGGLYGSIITNGRALNASRSSGVLSSVAPDPGITAAFYYRCALMASSSASSIYKVPRCMRSQAK